MLDRIEALESSVKYLEAIVKNSNKRKTVVDDDESELIDLVGAPEEPATQVASSKRPRGRTARK